MSDVLLEAKGIVRRYPGNVALKGVDFRVHRGQVNVLIGENGAGKSTLMRILSGVERPDEGTLLLDGKEVAINSPRAAAALGISIVHQELATLLNLDVSDNVFAGREMVRGSLLVDRAGEDRRSSAALSRLHHGLPLHQKLSQLSLGSRQVVELARAIAHGCRILILDEPTSALSNAEAETLFHVIDEIKAAGVTIVYISHRLHELLHLGDHFTVLRSGSVAGEATRADATREWIVKRMSGEIFCDARTQRGELNDAPITLEVKNLSLSRSSQDEEAQSSLQEISFAVRAGEILGIYGLLGSGRTELLEALAGHRRLRSGVVSVQGKTVRVSHVADAMRAGLVLVPEDRQRDGLVPELSVRENIMLSSASGMFVSRARECEKVRALIKHLRIAVTDMELPVSTLSGGNQQKVLLARCLLRKPVVLMLDEPTRGVDVHAKAEIYRTLRELAARGLAILFTSSEIEETKTLADRALVLCQGSIAAELRADEITDSALFAAASPQVCVRSFGPTQSMEIA